MSTSQPVSCSALTTSSFAGCGSSASTKVRSSSCPAMCSAMLSRMHPMRTMVPLSGTWSQKTVVQFGRAKIASETSRPTLRASTSHAATTWMSCGRYPPTSQCIKPICSFDHPPAEFRERFRMRRRTGVVAAHALAVRREAEGHRRLEFLERFHLPVEPVLPTGAIAVGPAEARAQVRNAEILHPAHSAVEPGIVEMEPLHDAHLRRVPTEVIERELGRSVFPDEAHVEVAVVRGAFRFAVARRRSPFTRQVEQ